MAKRRLTIFIKCSSSDVQQGSEYDSEGSLKIEFLVCLLHFFLFAMSLVQAPWALCWVEGPNLVTRLIQIIPQTNANKIQVKLNT